MTFDNRIQVPCLPRMVWSFVVLFMLSYTQIIPVSAAPPDLASNLTVEAITTTGAKVKWDQTPVGNPATFDNYEVSLSPNAGITFQPGPLITANSPNPETTISGLSAGVEYTVSVRTVNGTENTEKGTAKTITFNSKPPNLGGSVVIEAVKTTTATAKWTKPVAGTFTNYNITVVADESGIAAPTLNPSTVASDVASPSVALSNLVAGQVYTVSVSTNWDGVDGTPTTQKFRTKPLAVDAATITFSSITTVSASVSWTAVTSADSYDVAFLASSSASPSIAHNPSSTTATFTDLSPGVEYTVSITSKKGGVEGDATTKTLRTKPPNLGGSVVIEAVKTTTATAKWTKPAAGTFTNYNITVVAEELGIAAPRVDPSTVASNGVPLSVALTNLVAGQVYTVSVSTTWDGVDGTPTTQQFRTKPSSVSSIKIEALKTTSATIKWTALQLDSKYNSIYKYKVEIVQPVPPVPLPTVSPSEIQHPGISTGVTGMTPGKKYTVKVTTIAGIGSLEAKSDPAEHEFNAKPTPVTQTTIVFENIKTKTATAKWGQVSDGEFDEYKVSISSTGSTGSTGSTESPGPTINPNPVPKSTGPPTTTLTNLVPGTQYTLTVITVSGTTESSPSSATFTAKPSPVTGVSLTQNVNKMSITWAAGAGSIQSGYKVRYRAIFKTPASAWTEVPETTLSKEISITPGEKYEVEVIAISGDQSSDATPANLVTAPLPPATVSVTNSAATNTSIEVTWTVLSSASYFIKYIIEYTKEGATTPSQVEATPAERTKTIPGLEAGVQYSFEIFTETKEGKRSTTSTNTVGTAKPNCDVIVTDLSTETNKLLAHFTASTLVFTQYKFDILNGPKPTSRTLPKGTTTSELVYDQGVQPGNKYTIKASCVSNSVESDATDYSLASVPAAVTRVEPVTPRHDSVHMTIYKPEGTVSSVEISCLGPSIGPLNGCTFPKSGFFNGNTYNVTYDKLVADEDYTFTIKAISNTKKSAPKVVTVKTLEGRPGPVSGFTASAKSPTSVKLQWSAPQNPNGLITAYVVRYTGTYKANPGLTLPRDENLVIFADVVPDPGFYVKTLDGLKGGYEYDFVLFGKTSNKEDGENAASSVTMPTAAPALAIGAKPPQKTNMENRTIITAVFTKAFNGSNGPILYYSVIAAENNDDNDLPDKREPDDTILTWRQVKGLAVWQPYMAIRHCDIFDTTKNCEGSPAVSRRKRSTGGGDSVEVTIGIEDCTNKGTSDYCNGALKAGTSYQLRLRGYTGKKKYHDTPYSQRIPTTAPDQTGMIVGVVVGLIILLMIGAGVGIFFFIKYRKAADRRDKYGETGTPQPPADTKDRSRPVRLSDFPGHHAFMHADTDFRFAEEYEDLKDVGTHQTYEASELPHNRVKNRFTNILPYDWSRVKLSPLDDEEGSDYINANYIPGFMSKREYIACQGPLVSTKDDFWRMIWEQNCQAIVMLTRCVENGREKCSHYWPEDTDPVTYGDIEVVILNETQTQDYSITQLRVTKGEEVRRICHYHFMAWPDFSAPDVSGPLLRFLRIFREREGYDSSRPMCVHCSAGVGRSGTFITLDRLTQHMKQHDYVDIYGTVYEMRMHRRYMVQTEQQYIFIHRAILDIINDTVKPSAPSSPAIGRENPAFEDIPLNDVTTDDSKIADDEGITLEVLS